LIIGKAFYKTDIRKHGSGNIGATNVYRTFGPVPGICVFVADFLKGFLAAMLAKFIMGTIEPGLSPLLSILAGVIAMVGHSYSVFLRFEGGKGMSTAAGFIAAIWPQIVLVQMIVWIIVVGLTRYVSLASMIVAILFPVLVVAFEPLHVNRVYIVFSTLTAVVAVYRHRANIRRLLAGTELKMGADKAKKKAEGDNAE
jgi:glycerol-3-phosphate acyltransferase PlsY